MLAWSDSFFLIIDRGPHYVDRGETKGDSSGNLLSYYHLETHVCNLPGRPDWEMIVLSMSAYLFVLPEFFSRGQASESR